MTISFLYLFFVGHRFQCFTITVLLKTFTCRRYTCLLKYIKFSSIQLDLPITRTILQSIRVLISLRSYSFQSFLRDEGLYLEYFRRLNITKVWSIEWKRLWAMRKILKPVQDWDRGPEHECFTGHWCENWKERVNVRNLLREDLLGLFNHIMKKNTLRHSSFIPRFLICNRFMLGLVKKWTRQPLPSQSLEISREAGNGGEFSE